MEVGDAREAMDWRKPRRRRRRKGKYSLLREDNYSARGAIRIIKRETCAQKFTSELAGGRT
jgi:hypothetical protein